jgi:ATP-dependent helicase/nuclease subunit A
MAERSLPDAQARLQAATDLGRNIVVVAGAGTGKTSLLVERVLFAVGSGHVELTRLGAITFTEKAAGEMRARIATGLEELRAFATGERGPVAGGEAFRALAALRARGADPREVAARALAALEQLDHATIDTIHGFSATLLRSHPIEAGVDPGFAIDAGARAETVRCELWEEFVGRELGASAPRRALWHALLARFRIGDLRGIAFDLADFGVPPELLRPPFRAPDPSALLGETARALALSVAAILGRDLRVTEGATRYLRALGETLRTFVEAGLEAARALLAQQPDVEARVRGDKDRPRVESRPGLDEADRAEWNAISSRATHLLRAMLAIDDELVLRVLEAIAPFALDARERMLERGFVTFDGLLALARDLLRDHPQVRRAARERFRTLLVDELQDTDPRQYEIVLLLAAPDDAVVADPLAIVPEPGRLFLVGDPKQSIYRFRGADFGAYRLAVERVRDAGGVELALTANFRSTPGIVAAVNRLFEGAVWSPRGIDERHQPTYARIEAVLEPGGGTPAVEVWTIGADTPSDTETRREAESAALAEAIRRAVAEQGVAYRDVTVLLRALTNVSIYVRPLRERGSPFVVDGGSEFLKRPEVGHLLAALQTLADPGNQAALLAFLRSPAGGVSDVELADYAASGGRWSFRSDVDAAAFPRLARRFAELSALERELAGSPVDTLVRRVLAATRLLPLGACAFEGAQRVVNLRKLAAAAADLARDGTLSCREVLAAIGNGSVVELVSDAPLADDSIDAVRITSIHKIKGLENRWIFVPDLARGETRGDDERKAVARVVRAPSGAEILALRLADVHNATWVLWQVDNEAHEIAEEVRVLYVAATRARERLVLLVGPSGKNPAPWVRALGAWDYDPASPPEDGALLCDGLVLHRRLERPPQVEPRDESALETAVDEARRRHDQAIERLSAAASPFVTPSGLAEKDADGVRQSHAPEESRGVGRVVGIVVHRVLEAGTLDEALPLVDRVGREVAAAEGVDPTEVVREARAIVGTLATSPLGARLAQLEVLGREVPVLARFGPGTALRGTIDLIARDSDGAIVVIDYKTDRETDSEELRRVHGAQLRAYVEAVRDALGLAAAPRAEIWALRSGTVVPLG